MLGGGDGDEVGLVRYFGEIDAELRRIGDDVFHRLQLGHVIARFIRHAEAAVVGGEAPRQVFGDRARHRAFAPVIGRECQIPAAEHFVELFEVIERRVGGRHDVAPAVVPEILLQPVVLAGRRYELPDARRVRAGVGDGVVGAFDDGQQRDFARHATLFDLLDDVIEVAAAALDGARDVIGALGKPFFLLGDERARHVGQAEAGAYALPQAGRRGGQVHHDGWPQGGRYRCSGRRLKGGRCAFAFVACGGCGWGGIQGRAAQRERFRRNISSSCTRPAGRSVGRGRTLSAGRSLGRKRQRGISEN